MESSESFRVVLTTKCEHSCLWPCMGKSPCESGKLCLALDVQAQAAITQILPFPFTSFWYKPIHTQIQSLFFTDLSEAAALALAAWALHLSLRFHQVRIHL